MADQPEPTLADLVAWLRKEADKSRLAVILSEDPSFSGTPQDWAEDAAWHEAAARQLEGLAGQGREVARLRAVLGNIAENSAGDLGKLSHNQLTWKVDMIRRLVLAALAAPPAEEPRK